MSTKRYTLVLSDDLIEAARTFEPDLALSQIIRKALREWMFERQRAEVFPEAYGKWLRDSCSSCDTPSLKNTQIAGGFGCI